MKTVKASAELRNPKWSTAGMPRWSQAGLASFTKARSGNTFGLAIKKTTVEVLMASRRSHLASEWTMSR